MRRSWVDMPIPVFSLVVLTEQYKWLDGKIEREIQAVEMLSLWLRSNQREKRKE
ncbi:MAG: hypothetical protein GXO78_13310 [Calditrichaeota bacterium]|nr:hypothetical protein [Calditrichota bacterium]